jgi:hypothetical protein
MTDYAVGPADDRLHEAPTDDPFWTEAFYCCFAVPDRDLTGLVYAVLRPNQQVASLDVYLADGTGHLDQQVLYYQHSRHLPVTVTDDGFTLRGLTYRCLEPTGSYQLTYDDGSELAVQLRYEGIHDPLGRGHDGTLGGLNQGCHVTGTITLNGEQIEVDCYELRARAWTVRPDGRMPPLPDDRSTWREYGDTWGTSATGTFFVSHQGSYNSTAVRDGHLLRDGRVERVVSGQRTVLERHEDGYPLRIQVEGVDRAGRTFHAEGRCVSRVLVQGTAFIVWTNGIHWEVDGEPMWGRDDAGPLSRPARQLPARQPARA